MKISIPKILLIGAVSFAGVKLYNNYALIRHYDALDEARRERLLQSMEEARREAEKNPPEYNPEHDGAWIERRRNEIYQEAVLECERTKLC